MTEQTQRGRSRRRYTDEFKREAVNLYRESGLSAAQACDEFDINPGSLHRWAKDHDDAALNDRDPSYEELVREIGRLRSENDFLKKRPAISRLGGERPVLHSDHGSQYTSRAYRDCLERHQLHMSMGRVRACADNASAESVFGQFKRELLRPGRDASRRDAATHIDRYFAGIFNSCVVFVRSLRAQERAADVQIC